MTFSQPSLATACRRVDISEGGGEKHAPPQPSTSSSDGLQCSTRDRVLRRAHLRRACVARRQKSYRRVEPFWLFPAMAAADRAPPRPGAGPAAVSLCLLCV